MTTEKVINAIEEESDIDLGFDEEDPNETEEQKRIRKLNTELNAKKKLNQRCLKIIKKEREEKRQAQKEAQEMCDELIELKATINLILSKHPFYKYNSKK